MSAAALAAGLGRPPSAILRGAIGLGLFAAALAGASHYPLHPELLIATLALYGGLQYRLPATFLFLSPTVLACVNLYAWSGWYFIEVPDFFLLTTLAVESLRTTETAPQRLGRPLRAALLGFCISLAVSTAVALPPLESFSPTSLFDYTSPFNALRLLKGWGWALAALYVYRRIASGQTGSWRWFARGVVLALWIVALAAIRERWAYVGLLEFDRNFRVVSTFSSMHVGGSHIGVFLALAIPAAVAASLRDPVRWGRWTAGLALIPGAYTLLVTYTRGAWIATGVGAAAILAGAGWRRWQASHARSVPWRRLSLVAATLAACAVLVTAAWHGRFFQARIRTVPKDLLNRIEIFSETLAMMDSKLSSQLFGMGLGSYPRYYYARSPDGRAQTRREFVREEGNVFLRSLGPPAPLGDKLIFGQRVTIAPNQALHLRLRARSATPSLVLFELQERTILHSRKGVLAARLRELGKDWAYHDFHFNTGLLASEAWPLQRNHVLYFYNPTQGSVVDLDDIQLTDDKGRHLLRNGSFSEGHDFWYVQEQNHVAFQAKNALVGIYFEQGLLGAACLAAVFLLAARGALRGDSPAGMSAVGSLAGFFVICLSENPFTVPRLIVLALLFVAATTDSGPPESVSRDRGLARGSPPDGLARPAGRQT